jgi:hypothetical protein
MSSSRVSTRYMIIFEEFSKSKIQAVQMSRCPPFHGKYPPPSYAKCLKLWNKIRKMSVVKKAQMEIEARKIGLETQLSVQASAILKSIGISAVAGVELSQQLLTELIQCGAVDAEVTFTEISNNSPLKKAMLELIACSLSDKIDESRLYGKGVVSHFDLYFSCKTDTKLTQFLASIKFDAERNLTAVAELMKARDNMYALMRRTRDNTIVNMELMGTPDKVTESAKKKAKILTKDEAVERANGKVTMVVEAVESAKRKAVEEDSDDEEDAEMEDTFDTATSVNVTAKGTKRAATAPIDITEMATLLY